MKEGNIIFSFTIHICVESIESRDTCTEWWLPSACGAAGRWRCSSWSCTSPWASPWGWPGRRARWRRGPRSPTSPSCSWRDTGACRKCPALLWCCSECQLKRCQPFAVIFTMFAGVLHMEFGCLSLVRKIIRWGRFKRIFVCEDYQMIILIFDGEAVLCHSRFLNVKALLSTYNKENVPRSVVAPSAAVVSMVRWLAVSPLSRSARHHPSYLSVEVTEPQTFLAGAHSDTSTSSSGSDIFTRHQL